MGAVITQAEPPKLFRGRIVALWVVTALLVGVEALYLLGGAKPGDSWVPKLCFVVLAACGMLLGVAYAVRPGYYRGIQSLVDPQKHIVHWTYSDDEWHRFAEADWSMAKREIWKMPVKYALIGLGVGALLAVVPSAKVGWQSRLWVPIFAACAALVLTLLAMPAYYLAARWKFRRRLERTGEFYVGRHGIYECGAYARYIEWGLDSHLNSVKFEGDEPAIMHFTIEERVHRGTNTKHIRLPVPLGHKKEAERLQHQFGFKGT